MLGGAPRTPQTTTSVVSAPAPVVSDPSGGVTQGSNLAEAGHSAPVPTAALSPRPAASSPETPEQMLARAVNAMAGGKDPQRLLNVAIAHRDHWGRLEEQRAAEPEKFDGRASIYTGETYAGARDRWEAYRLLLVEETLGTHGGC